MPVKDQPSPKRNVCACGHIPESHVGGKGGCGAVLNLIGKYCGCKAFQDAGSAEARTVKRKVNEAEFLLDTHLRELLGYYAQKELLFAEPRKWRFDFAIPQHGLAIEIEGSAWTQGRHTRGAGFINDMEKYNHAVLHDWKILRFTPQQVLNGEAISFVKRVLEAGTE